MGRIRYIVRVFKLRFFQSRFGGTPTTHYQNSVLTIHAFSPFGRPACPVGGGEIGNLLPNNLRQRRTCYALCHILYPVSAALASFFRMDSISIRSPPPS